MYSYFRVFLAENQRFGVFEHDPVSSSTATGGNTVQHLGGHNGGLANGVPSHGRGVPEHRPASDTLPSREYRIPIRPVLGNMGECAARPHQPHPHRGGCAAHMPSPGCLDSVIPTLSGIPVPPSP